MPARAALRRSSLPIGLVLALLVLIVLSAGTGTTDLHYDFGSTLRGLLARLGLAEPLGGADQVIVENRWWRTLVAAGVGASLAYSGALLQGVFRNGLAAPSIIGVTSGANLGANLAIILVGGNVVQMAADDAPLLVTLFGFLGAAGVTLLVASIATRGGRLSVPTLLLTGIAVNVCASGILAALQSWLLRERWEIAQAIFGWTYGSFQDRTLVQVGIILGGLALSTLAIPFTARELDLFAGGEEDAEALGVNTTRVKLLAIGAAALAASCAVAVAGPIAFVGLVVPHVLRLSCGTSHRRLLPLSLLGGAGLMLGADYLNRGLLSQADLQPGVMMSLIGGPLFLFLLVRGRTELATW